MKLRVHWSPVAGEIASYIIFYQIKVPGVDKYKKEVTVNEENCPQEEGQHFYDITIPKTFVNYYYNRIEAFECTFKVRAVGKNGKKGAWSKKEKALDGAKPEEHPIIESLTIEDREGSIYLENIMFQDETPDIIVEGDHFKNVDTLAVAKVDRNPKFTLKQIRKGKSIRIFKLDIDESSRTNNYIRGKIRNPLEMGEYVVFLKQKKVISKGIAVMDVLSYKKRFGAFKVSPILSAHVKFQTLTAEGYGFTDIIKTKDINFKRSIRKGVKGGLAIGSLVGAGWEYLTHPITTLANLKKAFMVLIAGPFTPKLLLQVITGGGIGAVAGATLGFIKEFSRKGIETYSTENILQSLLNAWHTLFTNGYLSIPIKRSILGSQRGLYKKRRDEVISVLRDEIPNIAEVVEEGDFIINPRLFRVMDGGTEAKGIRVLFSTIQIAKKNDPEVKYVFGENKIMMILGMNMDEHGDTPIDNFEGIKPFKLQGYFVKKSAWADIGEIRLKKNIGTIKGEITVNGDILGSRSGKVVGSEVSIENET